MKKAWLRIAVSALAVCLMCACLPLSAYALPAQCGENVRMRYDSETNTYTLYGSGPTFDFDEDPSHAPATYDRVVIEAGVTYVGAYLFHNDHIGELVMPDAPITVHKNAFSGCEIDLVTFPQTAVDASQYELGSGFHFGNATVYNLDLGGLDGFPHCFCFTYGDNYDLLSLIVGANTTVIPENACNCFGALESLTLPDGLLEIGDYAFESCETLQAVRIPDSVTTIGNYAFDYCACLETLTLPQQLQTIGEWAFSNCAMTSLTIPPHTTTIGISAFSDCANLAQVTIPDSVTTIGINAFSGTALQNVHLPAGLQNIHASSLGESIVYVCCDTDDCPIVKQYCEAAEVEFRLCDGHGPTTPAVAGDANGDGVLNLRDTVLIRRYLAGGWDVEIDEAAADANGDGVVTLDDAILLNRYIAGGWDVILM